MKAKKKLCLVTGVGPGTGSALVERYVSGGYDVAMLARTNERLDALSKAIPGAYPFPCDVTDAAALGDVIAAIREAHGMPHIVIHNAVGGAFGNFLDISPSVLETNFRTNTLALLHLAQLTAPAMMELGEGAIMATGNTSAYRGKAGFAGFAPTKAAQRILLESIARHAGPKGVHAAYVAIDAVIDLAWTRKQFPDKPDGFFCKPADIAEVCFAVSHQPRSAWSFEVTVRPFGEPW